MTVIADRGLGLRGLGRALRSARPRWVVGPPRALRAARALRWAPGASLLDVGALLAVDGAPPAEPDGAAPAAVLFTSGATGPAKGVRHRHDQLEAQRDALRATYSIGDDDRLVAAFAPFALYGPALGIATALPDCDVTRPATLTAGALDEACRVVDATMAFASPAALRNVVATRAELHGHAGSGLRGLRLVMSAGAPVPAETLADVAALAPSASLRTPYGMTEALPVADVSLDEIRRAEADDPRGGVCVGSPVAGAEVRIAPLDFDAAAGVPPAVEPGASGEILVRAPWVSEGYLGLWGTERSARPGAGWHRSGDVGHVDDVGRLWVAGRAVHVVRGTSGPLASVALERPIERRLGGSARVAVVGVGPAGCQQVVVVVERQDLPAGLAPDTLAGAVRGAVDAPVAAVLCVPALPVDIRHNAKIDRTAVSGWADALLAGRRPPRRGWRP